MRRSAELWAAGHKNLSRLVFSLAVTCIILSSLTLLLFPSLACFVANLLTFLVLSYAVLNTAEGAFWGER